MKSATNEARRIWTTVPRRDWAAELQKYPPLNTKPTCSREAVREALRLALSAVEMGGVYQGMTADNRFSVANAGSGQESREA